MRVDGVEYLQLFFPRSSTLETYDRHHRTRL